mgnify:CR=1 FL=1
MIFAEPRIASSARERGQGIERPRPLAPGIEEVVPQPGCDDSHELALLGALVLEAVWQVGYHRIKAYHLQNHPVLTSPLTEVFSGFLVILIIS